MVARLRCRHRPKGHRSAQGTAAALASCVALALFLIGALVPALSPQLVAAPAQGAKGETLQPYTVAKGDTLYSLARRFGTTVEELARLNGLEDPSYIRAGQVLWVPAFSEGAAQGEGPGAGGPPSSLPAAAPSGGAAVSKPPSALATPEGPAVAAMGPLLPAAGSGGLLVESEVRLLAKLIEAESRGEPFEGQVAVGAVVVNRVRDPRFPDTLAEVIYAPGQFPPAEAGMLLLIEPSESALLAARLALSGLDPTGGALFFYNPAKTTNPEFWATRIPTRRIGNHVFTR